MTPAPLPSLFPASKGYGDSVCDHLKATVQYNVAFTAFMNWGFNADGSFSDNFLQFIQTALTGCTTSTTTTTTTTLGTATSTATTSSSTTQGTGTTLPTTTYTAPLPPLYPAPIITQSLCQALVNRDLFDQDFISFYNWMVAGDGTPTAAFSAAMCNLGQSCA